MSDIGDLYQQTVLDHNKKPRNFGRLANANRSVEGYNPLCGDKIRVDLRVEDGVIENISFEGMGCAIAKASASMMTDALKGKKVEEAEDLFDEFHDAVTGEMDPMAAMEQLGKIGVLSGVSEFPSRVKCAILAWHTLRAALRGSDDSVSTE